MISRSFSEHFLIHLHGQDWLDKQRVAGRCVAACLLKSKELIEARTPNLSLKNLEEECASIIQEHQCEPTFWNYKGFPGKICASVNKQLVHGIPSDYVLKPGDVVKIDLGATYQGAIADAASTFIYGDFLNVAHVELLEACKNALQAAIRAIKPGNRLGCIGSAIHHQIKRTRFGLITKYGGHHISWNTPHAPVFIPNKANSFEGIRIQPGSTFAIEPMIVIGDNFTRVLDDGWTVMTNDIGAHEEHTVYVHEDQVEIITANCTDL